MRREERNYAVKQVEWSGGAGHRAEIVNWVDMAGWRWRWWGEMHAGLIPVNSRSPSQSPAVVYAGCLYRWSICQTCSRIFSRCHARTDDATSWNMIFITFKNYLNIQLIIYLSFPKDLRGGPSPKIVCMAIYRTYNALCGKTLYILVKSCILRPYLSKYLQ